MKEPAMDTAAAETRINLIQLAAMKATNVIITLRTLFKRTTFKKQTEEPTIDDLLSYLPAKPPKDALSEIAKSGPDGTYDLSLNEIKKMGRYPIARALKNAYQVVIEKHPPVRFAGLKEVKRKLTWRNVLEVTTGISQNMDSVKV